MKKALKVVLIVFACVLVLLIALVQPIDRTAYQDTAHYKVWKGQVEDINIIHSEGLVQVSWAKVNITPEEPTSMGGYGQRWGKPFESVHDSLYVRAIAVRNPVNTVYFVSADMLIIPPNLTERVGTLLAEEGISLSDVHFGTTHTHHGLGEWGQKLAGRIFSGKYSVEREIRLANQFKEAILGASTDMVDAEIMYTGSINSDNIRNRLRIEGREAVDPWIRSLVFCRTDGREARLLTYGAHNTILPARTMVLSRDYAGQLVDSLEGRGTDFVLYMAGAIGSMAPRTEGETAFDHLDDMVDGMLRHIDDSVSVPLEDILVSQYIEIPMPKPSVRILKNFSLRPWVFRTFFGEQSNQLRITQIGKTLVVGVPADFSGEIMRELDAYADAKGIELIITSFNGGYNGYVTPDDVYDYDVEETRIMSWTGYQFGGYITEVIKDIIDKVGE